MALIKRLKVSDLTNIHERPVLVMYVEKQTPRWGDAEAEVLHIIRRDGDKPNRHGEPVPEHVTNCNRILQYARVFTKGDIAFHVERGNFKVCARCGTVEDFEAALIEYQEWRAENDRKYREKEAEEQRQREAAWKAYLSDVQKLRDALVAKKFDAKYQTDEGLTITFNGRKFDVTEARD